MQATISKSARNKIQASRNKNPNQAQQNPNDSSGYGLGFSMA